MGGYRMDIEQAKIGHELQPAPLFVIDGNKFCVKSSFFVLLCLKLFVQHCRKAEVGSIIVEVGNNLALPRSVFCVHTQNIYRITVAFPPRQPSSSQNSRFSFSINTRSAYLTPSSECSSVSAPMPSCRRAEFIATEYKSYCEGMKNFCDLKKILFHLCVK